MDHLWKRFDIVAGITQGLIGTYKKVGGDPTVNLLTNGAFTSGLTGWAGDSGLALESVNYRSAPYSGSALFNDSDYNPAAYYIQSTGVVSGERYSASVWVKNYEIAQQVVLILYLGTQYYSTLSNLPVSSSWQQIKIENKFSDGTRIEVAVAGLGQGMFYVDDATLVYGPTALA